jgi:hypothetical protein
MSAATFLDALEDSASITMGAKVQVYGVSGTGKSHDAYLSLPRPLVVIDSDVAAGLFTDDRFEGFKRLGPDKVPDLAALLAFFEEFCRDPRWHRQFKSILVDSLTMFVDEKVAALGIDQSSESKDRGKGQVDYARAAKALTRLIRRASALGVHVYVTAEERTRYEGGRPAQGDDAGKSSLSPSKFTHAFDLIVQKVAAGEVVVKKSRYARWPKDARVPQWNAARDLGTVFAGAEPKAAGMDAFDPATRAHEELMALLKALGSTVRGGVIPPARMRTLLATAHDNEIPETEVRGVINALKREFVDAVGAGAEGAPTPAPGPTIEAVPCADPPTLPFESPRPRARTGGDPKMPLAFGGEGVIPN